MKGGNLGQAGWGLSEEAEKARTDLQQQRGSARQDYTVQGLNQGFGLGGERVRVCVGGGEERRRVRAEARASKSGCRLANLSSSSLMR